MTRYFEDVSVDDELEPVERTPTLEMAIEFFGRDNPTNPAFRDAELGKAQGFGGALVPGVMKMAWITQFVGSWAGEGASIANLRVAFRRPDVADRPLVFTGRVVDKREEAGKKVAELEVVTLADGQPSVRANVQVELPSRS